MTMDRFQAPTANDDLAICQDCGERYHYGLLDNQGLCPHCHDDRLEDEEQQDEQNLNQK